MLDAAVLQYTLSANPTSWLAQGEEHQRRTRQDKAGVQKALQGRKLLIFIKLSLQTKSKSILTESTQT